MTDKESTEIATQPIGEAELMAFGEVAPTTERPKSLGRDDVSGTEGIDPDEVRLPRLSIAQGLSPQMTPGDTKHIEGLTLFDMFNDQSREVYRKGPMTFIAIRRDWKAIEFTPRSEGGGVVDLNVPKKDPRLKWTWSTPELKASGAKADVPPKAVIIIEFTALLLRKGKAPEPIVFGIALKNKWNRDAEAAITGTLAQRSAPIYMSMFSVDTTVPGKNDKGTFGVPTIRDLGYIPKDTPAGAALAAYAKGLHERWKDKKIVSDVEDEDVDDSMANNPEAPAGPGADM